jgi:hypothetical protein
MLVANSSSRATMEEIRNHPWVTIEDSTPPPRVYLKRLAELDKEVVKQMVDLLGFEEQSILFSLNHNDFNQFTTTYQLLLAQKNMLKSKQKCNSSLTSNPPPAMHLPSNPALSNSASNAAATAAAHSSSGDSKEKGPDHHLCVIS